MASNLRGIVKDKDDGDVLQSRTHSARKETLFYAQLKHKYLARAGTDSELNTWPGVEAALGEFMARLVKYIKKNEPRMTEVHKLREGEKEREGGSGGERGCRESKGSLLG